MSNVISPAFRNQLIDGGCKVIYQSETKGVFVSYFKEEELMIAEIRAALSARLFTVLTSCGIRNHFLCSNGVMEHKIVALDMLPFKFVIYSVVDEGLSKKIFLRPGLRLDKYLIEIYLKTPEESVLLSKEHLVSLGYLSQDLVEYIFSESRRIMDIILAFFKAIGFNVFSLSLSFGKQYKNEGQDFDILLGDEMSLKNIGLSLSNTLAYNQNDSYLKIAKKLDFDV